MDFKIGDMVRVIDGSREAPGESCMGMNGVDGTVGRISSFDESTNSHFYVQVDNGQRFGCFSSAAIQHLNKPKQSTMKSLIEKARLLAKGEPEKSLIAKGITDINDVLTAEDQELFNDFLYRSNKAAFVTDPVVAAVLAEKDEK